MLAERYFDLIRGRTAGLVASLARGALWMASEAYAGVTALRNRLYDRRRLSVVQASVPVVSVGNLTAGGTGKTPCVEYLARFYRDRGRRVAILSRGYGTSDGPNDEALVLAANLGDIPHLQGPDRAALAKVAVEKWQADLLILDDGFQHRRLARDLDIVLVDATCPWGHGHMLPRGLLREPKSALKRAGAVVLTRSDQPGSQRTAELRAEVLRLVRAGTPVVEAMHRPLAWLCEGRSVQPPETFRGRAAGAFCGIGRPDAFQATMAGLAVELCSFRAYSDHHAYSRGDVDELQAWASTLPADAIVLTTQKDAVKLRMNALGGRELWALQVGFELAPGDELAKFEARLRTCEA